MIEITTFGYLHGPAPKAMMTLDLRDFLRDPARMSPRLLNMDGRDEEVRQVVLGTPGAGTTLQAAAIFVMGIPEARGPVTVAIGCAGGKHRAAAMGGMLAEILTSSRLSVNLVHRDAHHPRVLKP